MPRFKTTLDIFKTGEEFFDPNWDDKPFLELPPSPAWDDSRELQIEDVDIWEVIFESGGGIGLYAAWCPYFKFFMFINKDQVDTFYGSSGEKRLEARLAELKMDYPKV
jgi:hypothetical protein